MIDPDSYNVVEENTDYNTLSDAEWRNVEDVVFSVLEDCAKKIPICQHAEITDDLSYKVINEQVSDYVNLELHPKICGYSTKECSENIADNIIEHPAIAVMCEYFNRRISKLEDIVESVCGLEKLSIDKCFNIHPTSTLQLHSVTYCTDDFKEQVTTISIVEVSTSIDDHTPF